MNASTWEKRVMRPRGHKGFTLLELMMVVAIIAVATVIAWPTLSSFADKNAEAGAATDVARLVNRVRDQAQRRNRAYLLRFDNFDPNQPRGSMEIIEGAGPSCRGLAAAPGDGRPLETVPFGGTPQGAFNGHVERKVGLSGWLAPGGDAERQDAVEVCLGTDGSASWLPVGGVPQPIGGRLRVRVQRFGLEDGNWRRQGPPRAVEITFAGGAQMGVN